MSGGATQDSRPREPDRVRLLRFRVGDRACAVEVGRVAGIVDTPSPTPVPGTDPTVAGVVRLRDEVTVVGDLHRVLGTDRRLAGEDRTLVLEREADATPVAFAVDDVERLADVHVDGIVPAEVAESDERVFVAAADTDGERVGVVGVKRFADLLDDAVR